MSGNSGSEGGGLTALGKLISFVMIIGLIGLGVYVFRQQSSVSPTKTGGASVPEKQSSEGVEAPDLTDVTTVKEYKYVPADRLPPVKGVSQYEWDEEKKILRFSYNVWAGWLPIIAANRGVKPNPESVFAKKYGFQVELVLMDDPVAARDAFAAGKVHTLWGTVDMMVLFAPELLKDARAAPRIMQQLDWSSGGDGIVARKNIRNFAGLRGKTVALAKNSPSEYFLYSLLLSAGMRPGDVKPKFTATAFEAAAAFAADKTIDACVSWAPDIYKIPERDPGSWLLASTADAGKLIADVYAVRADFARDHPEIIEGLVAGIFEGMDLVKKDSSEACKWMADAFGMKPEDVEGMRQDFHSTNFEENVQFFLNASNPVNFERTWKNAAYVYRELGSIGAPAAFDQVLDFSVVQNLQKKGTFAHHRDESTVTFSPAGYKTIEAEAPLLTQTIRVNFFPNSANPYEQARDELGNKLAGKLYDPNVDATLERVAGLSGQFARAVILIEGHADSSMKGKVPDQAVKELSVARAEAIKTALIQKYKFDPNKFVVKGVGWDKPFDLAEPLNQALNRRVEISVYPPEAK